MRENEHGRLRVLWHSLGCKVNLADLGRVFSLLPVEIFDVSASIDEADVAVLNTCTVTHKADRDWRKVLSGWRRRRPGLPVVVTGCAAVLQEKVLRGFPNVAEVIRPGEDSALVQALGSFSHREAGAAGLPRPDGFSFPLGRQRAFLKIQDGCDARCSYCVVSRIRGRERSLALEDAVGAVKQAIEGGFHEVVLCGIHLGRYGRQDGASLAELLRALGAFWRRHPGWRIRLSSIEPLEWSEELLRAVAEAEFVCRHFHVPIQSGDDGVLERMGRPYTSAQARQTLERLRECFPDAALGTDILAGFPGEDDAAFARTLDFVEEGWLDYLHVFAFSPRPETPAYGLPGRVEPARLRQRVSQLRAAGKRRWDDFLGGGVGREHEVLVERLAGGLASGRSGRYRKLVFDAAGASAGRLLRVTGVRLDSGILRGRQVVPWRKCEGRREMAPAGLR